MNNEKLMEYILKSDGIIKDERFLMELRDYKQMGIIDHYRSIERIKGLVKENVNKEDIIKALGDLQKYLSKQNDSIIRRIEFAYKSGMRQASGKSNTFKDLDTWLDENE
tara:strand:+ start:130 stop:456 length:327 start_codon:yes stop_codon:yes gene_type:complete